MRARAEKWVCPLAACGCVQNDVTPVKWRSFCARRNQESNGGSVLL